MPILSPPPLPVERFEEFKHFARTLDPAGWANATGVALSIQHMLGIAIVGPDAEEEALQQWAADFGTERWREASERAQRAAEQPLPYAFSFGFGLPLQGLDQAAWTVPPSKILELNSWLRWALSQFYDAHGQTPDPVLPEPTQSTAIEPTQPAPTAKRVRASPALDSSAAAIRKSIAEERVTRDQLRKIRVDDLPTHYPGVGGRTTLNEARKIVLDEPAQ
jgi:hypothetical protein